MHIKTIAKGLIPIGLLPVAKKLLGQSDDGLIQDYIKNGRVPWSKGYNTYRVSSISSALQDCDLLKKFSRNSQLPSDYGVGIDERCVELPWLFSKLPVDIPTFLDAGSALNQEFLLGQECFAKSNIHILTLAPENQAFWQKGISYLYADLRAIPIQANYYDEIACISTLEHIGFDNLSLTHNQNHQEDAPDSFILAMQELKRVLKLGGSLFLTVPFGKYQNFKSFQQFDSERLASAIQAFGTVSSVQKTFYRYSEVGWDIATEEDCQDCEYAKSLGWLSVESSSSSSSCQVEIDRAAAARSVACIHFIK